MIFEYGSYGWFLLAGGLVELWLFVRLRRIEAAIRQAEDARAFYKRHLETLK